MLLGTGFCFAQVKQSNLTGPWVLIVDQGPEHIFTSRVQLAASGHAVSGAAGSFGVRGSVYGADVKIELLKPNNTVALSLSGEAEGDVLRGAAKDSDGLAYTWIAERQPSQTSTPRRLDFTPKTFSRYFSGSAAPVLRIRPGDTVRTSTVDSGGFDAFGKHVSHGANPLTGPFYVEGALPGDTLVVKLTRISMNRDWARSGTEIVSNAVAPEYTAGLHRNRQITGRWHLDLANDTASIEGASPAAQNLKIPLQPMIGGIGVAPPKQEVANTRASGSFGGNMDYSRLRQGSTVYLPVYQPGALLLIGDAHAAEGDGELAGDALETSMDVEFTVDIIKDFPLNMPYAEDGDSWMAIGIGGSLEDAMRKSTTAMATYLEKEHGLNPNETAMLLGAAMKYDIADVVGDQVSIVARIPLTVIAQLPTRKDHF